MANVKQGNKTRSPQWWKHLRDWKRVFWKSERQAQKKDIKNERSDQMDHDTIGGNLLCILSYYAHGRRICGVTLLYYKVWNI